MSKIISLLFLFSQINLFAQIISSTTQGGHWNSPSTWVGNVVPNANSDVVINGLVIISNVECKNLTINSNGIIEDEPSSGRTLTINGDFINYGTVRNGQGYAGVTLLIKGNMQNYGTLVNRWITFGGTASQQILSTNKISCSGIDKNPNGTIISTSDLEIDSVTAVILDYDLLNMGSYKLTKISRKNIDNSGSIITGGTIYSNGQLDISGQFGSDLDGNPTLTGNIPLLFVGNNKIKQNLTIASGKTVSDEPSSGRTIYIDGNLINYGIIKNRYAGLIIQIKGNVENHGEFSSFLRLAGDNNQKISGTKIFSCGWIEKNPNGYINAASDLVIDSTSSVNLDGDVLNMGSYKLTKISRKNIDNSGSIITGGTIYSNGQLDISGQFGSDLDGNPTLTGNIPLLFVGNNKIKQNLTIASGKTVSDEPSSGRTIYIDGNLINYGIIKNRYAGLTIQIKGNVENHGEFYSFLRLAGDNNQKISGTKIFSCGWIEKNPNGKINAASDLVFDSTTTISLHDDTLNMGTYNLIKLSKKDFVNSDFIFKEGIIYSDGEIDISGKFGSHLDGDFILAGKDTMLFTGNNIIYNNLRVAKEKVVQDECCAGRNIFVYGDIYNYGTIKNRFGGLTCYSYGNVYNYGRFEINWLIVQNDSKTLKLYGTFYSNVQLENKGASPCNFFVDQLLNVKYVLVNKKDVILTINNNSELIVDKIIENNGTIINNGKITNRYYLYYSGNVDTQPFMKIKPLVYDRGTSDSLIVTTNNSLHPRMSSAIKRYWNIQGNKKLISYSVELYYDDDILNGQDPNNLEAYITTDNGETWKKISNPVNTTRDLTNKKITVGNRDNPITLFGDIILSSGNVANISSISVAITGRKQVRVGPPNRFTISYWNNNNYPTDKFFLILKTNQGVYFEGMYSKKINVDSVQYIPIDSLVYNNQKDEIILLVQPLGPKEVRSFDVIVKSALGTSFKVSEPITFSTIALWVGGAILEEYISNTVVNGCYEVWRPVGHDETLTDASVKVLKNSLGKAVTIENGVKGVAKKAADEIVKKTGRAVLWPVFLAQDIFDCLSNTVRGIKDYLNGNFDKQEKELIKVTSWDPNAKEGIAGYGEEGFISSTATMNYTIFFENKKEATAPAYQIVILDTLDENVFDVNTVKFGDVSHPLVNKTISRTGNILKWDFVGIELPPNINPPEGEGWVKFTINLKPNLKSGIKIQNKAVITFDINKPLATNTVINTLDFDPPSSEIKNITQTSLHELLIDWSGSDGIGSGIKTASIFISVGDAPFSLAAVSDKSPIKIPVQPENSYRVYVLATDNVGNTQQSPAQIHQITVDVKDQIEIPKDYNLEQNYPNPFNPVTKIIFSIPKKTRVELSIYNILGEKILELLNSEIEAGKYEYEFNAINLSSGVYFYRLKTEDYISVKKMILIK